MPSLLAAAARVMVVAAVAVVDAGLMAGRAASRDASLLAVSARVVVVAAAVAAATAATLVSMKVEALLDLARQRSN